MKDCTNKQCFSQVKYCYFYRSIVTIELDHSSIIILYLVYLLPNNTVLSISQSVGSPRLLAVQRNTLIPALSDLVSTISVSDTMGSTRLHSERCGQNLKSCGLMCSNAYLSTRLFPTADSGK